jgi:hypothetical protein
MPSVMMRLIETGAGQGTLLRNGTVLRQVRYDVRRYQGFMEGSALPIPGLFRIEGSVDFDAAHDAPDWINVPLTLRLDDGRSLGIIIADNTGRVLSEGHGPLKCMCC